MPNYCITAKTICELQRTSNGDRSNDRGCFSEARAVGSDELSVTPEEAVFSLGIDAHEQSGGNPTIQDGYAAICPYVKAFSDREAYERWADTVPAATVGMPLAGATEVASALVA